MLALTTLAFACAIQAQEAAPAVVQRPVVPATVAEELIPAHTFGVLRLRSLERLAEIALPYQRIEDEKAQPVDVLPLLGAQFGIEAKWELIDRRQPILVAVSSSLSNQPAAFTVIAGSRNSTEFAADPRWSQSGITCTANGSFVVVATEPAVALLAKTSPLRAGLDQGEVVVRIDAQEVLAQYGDMFLGEFRSGIEGAENEAQRDLQTKMFDTLSSWLDAIETLGVRLNARVDRTEFAFEMTAIPGSVLADVEKIDTKPLEAMARCIDPQSPFAFVGALDYARMMKPILSLIDVDELAESAPPEEAAKARQMMADMLATYENLGPLMAGGARFGSQGVTASYVLRPRDVTKLLEAYGRLFAFEPGLFQAEGPTTSTIAGHEVQRYRFRIQSPAGGMSEVTNDVEAVNLALEEMLTKLFGTNAIPFAYTMHEGAMIACLGDDAVLESTLARAGSSTSSVGDDLLAQLGAHNPGCAMRIDTGELARQVVELMRVVGETPPPDADQVALLFRDCGPLRLTWGLDQRTWRLAFDGDFLRIAKAFAAMPRSEPQPAEIEVEDMSGDVEEPAPK